MRTRQSRNKQKKRHIVIGLVGKMRSGKDTVSDYFRDGNSYVRVAYGDALKLHYHLIFGHGRNKGKDRKAYQQFGQLMRQIDPDIWVKHAQEGVNAANEAGVNVVITDVRQPNEVEHIRRLDGFLIRINASDDVRLQRMNESGDTFTLSDLQHETESYIDGFDVDYEITNEGTREELLERVALIRQEIEQLAEGGSARMANLDRFSHGKTDPQEVKEWGRCDNCGAEIYSGEEIYVYEDEVACSVSCVLILADIDEGTAED